MSDLWTVTSTISAAVAAVAALAAAAVSLFQILEIRRTAASSERAEKTLRTFEHSPASSPKFFDSQFALSSHFTGWATGTPVTDEQARTAFVDRQLMAHFNYVLNHYGRMAAALHYEIADSDVAENLFKFGFLRFWSLFEPYLEAEFQRRPQVAQQYALSKELFVRWKAKQS